MWAAAENLHKAMRQGKNQKFFPFFVPLRWLIEEQMTWATNLIWLRS